MSKVSATDKHSLVCKWCGKAFEYTSEDIGSIDLYRSPCSTSLSTHTKKAETQREMERYLRFRVYCPECGREVCID